MSTTCHEICMYIWRTNGDRLSIRETHPSLDCTREIKGIRFIRINEFISNLLRYPRRSSSDLKIFQRTTSQLTSYVETFPTSCVKCMWKLTNLILYFLFLYVVARSYGDRPSGESWRLAWMHVINSTRITGTEHAFTDWVMPVNWSWSWRWSSFVEETSSVQSEARKPAVAQEWQRVTRGYGRRRDVTLVRIELTKGIKDRKGTNANAVHIAKFDIYLQ